jgi:acyl carrier protein
MPEGNLSTIIKIICTVGNVAELRPDQDFYDAGFTSVNALPLLMEMEDHFQVTIPDDRFIGARTPRALSDVIAELKQG